MKVHEYNEMMAYMLRPRQKFAIGGGVIEGEDLGTREGFYQPGDIEKEYKGTLNYKELIKDKDFEDFWKARVDGTPMSEVRTGTFAGEDVTYNSIQDVIKKYKLKSNDYEKIFNKVLDEVRTAERIRKGVKGFENKKPLVPVTILSNLIKTFNASYKPNVGTINTNEMEKLLNLTKGELSKIMSSIDRPYPEDKFRFANPTATFVINKAAVLKNKLEKAGITYEKIGRDGTPLPPGRDSGSVGYRFRLGNDKKTANKKIKELEKSKTFGFPESKKKPSLRFRNIVSSLSKQSDEYKKYGYGRDRNAVTNLTTALNNSLRGLNDKQLYKFINNNPKIKNLVTAVFDAQTGEIKNVELDKLTSDQIRDKAKFEVDHIRGRSTVDYDPATKKILDGLNIEYPKNLYIIPKAINDSVKRQVETFVKDNPDEKTKIKKINNYFKKNKLTYYNSVSGKYEGYKPSKSAVDLSHLGITKIQELKKLITGTFIDDKGIERVKTSDPNKLIATVNELQESRGGPKLSGKFALPVAFLFGGGYFGTGLIKEISEGRNPFSMSAQAAETGEQTKEQNPSFIEEYPYLVGTTAAASPLLTKTGRKIYGGVLKGGLKAFGSVPSGLGFSASQFVDINPFSDEFGELQEDPNLILAGADLLLPELGKKFSTSGTGRLAQLGRYALNPFQLAEKASKFGKVGRGIASLARVPSLMTPVGLTLMGAGVAKDYYDFAKDEIEKVRAMSPEERQAYNEMLTDEGGMVDISREGFDEGGPSDPSKRKFMKIMGGLASLPVVGKFFRVAEQTPVVQNIFTEIQKLKNSETIMPDWFPTFLDKFRREGVAENIFKKKKVEVSKAEYDKAFAEGRGQDYYTDVARTQEYKANNPDHMDYYKLEDTDQLIGTTYTNEKVPGVKVDDFDGEVSVNWENDYSQPVSIEYVKPGAIGPDMGRVDKFQSGIEKRELKPKGEFAAVDQEVYATDPDGGFDTNPVVVESLDDMMEGTTRVMEEYATGKPVRTLSRGEGKVIEAEIRAEQAAESAAEMADDFDDF